MATGGPANQTPGPGLVLGFPKEIVISGNVDPKFLCALCEQVLRTPMQSFCGHRFCQACIKDLLKDKESEICPGCRKEECENEFSELKLDKIFPDNAIKRDFTTVKVKCLNQGCPWTGNLKIYEEHEKKCEYLSVQCDLCGQFVAVPKKTAHDREECPQRPLVCKYCRYKGPAVVMNDHIEYECPARPYDCPHCNVKAIPRSKLFNHYDYECPSEMAMCRVARCGNVGPKGEIDQHKLDSVLSHIEGINQKLLQIDQEVKGAISQNPRTPRGSEHSENTTTSLGSVNKKIESIEKQIESLTLASTMPRPEQPQQTGGATGGIEADSSIKAFVEQKMAIQDQKIATFESIAAVLNSEILKCLNKTDECMNKINTTNTQFQELAQRVNTLEESNREKGETLERLQRDWSTNTETSYDGTFVWKVTEVGRRRQEAITGRVTSIYSPAFFTSRTGYRMCLRMYLNGDGMGRGSHLSLYFVLMRGPYDALLKWPFRQKVTLMMLDQNRREHVIDAFRPDPSSSSFKQPSSEMNIASGCPLFTPLTTLDTAGAKAYIKDDTLFIKCVVDTSDLVQ